MSLKKLLSLRKGNSKATTAIKPKRTTVRRMIIESLEDRSMLNSTPIIIDNLSPNFTKTGNWNLASGRGYLGSDYYATTPFDGSEVANWTFNVEPGSYRVSATWHAANVYHANNTPIKVIDGATLVGTVALNQEPAPNDFFENSAWWETIGTFTVGTTLRVQMTDAANEHVIADAFRVERIAPVQIIDNLSSGFTKSGDWNDAIGPGYAGSVVYSSYPLDGSEIASWSFTVGPGTYRIAGTWHAGHAAYGSNIPVQVFDGTNLLGTVPLSQKFNADDFFENRAWWENVGTFTIATSLRVQVTNAADGLVLADAFRAEKIEKFVSPVIVDNRGSAFSKAGNWSQTSGSGFDGSYYQSNAPHDGSEVANWTFVVEPGTYRIANTWFGANASHGSNIPIHIFDGSTLIANVPWNQQLAPNDFLDEGTWWESIGVFTFRNTIRIQMSDYATGQAIADAFRLERVGNGMIIDNRSPGFTTTGTWNTVGSGYAGDSMISGNPPGGSKSASWSFAVEPGTYRVSLTWPQPIADASNAPFQVYDGATSVLSKLIDQDSPAPNDFFENGIWWETLGLVTVSSTLRVHLTDLANAPVIADAVRVEKIDKPVTSAVADNLSSTFSRSGTWSLTPDVGYDASYYTSSSTYYNVDTANWSFAVDPGTYRIAVTWPSVNINPG
ncbi:MAG: hypothetical protein ABL921_33300, partial [Pirellula sp.]